MILTKATSDNQLITTWLLDKQSPLSQKQYQTSIRQFIRYIGCPLSDVKIEDLQGYLRMLEMKGNKPSTIKGKLSRVLRACLASLSL